MLLHTVSCSISSHRSYRCLEVDYGITFAGIGSAEAVSVGVTADDEIERVHPGAEARGKCIHIAMQPES